MKIPTFTKQQIIANDKHFTSEMQQFFDILTGQMQASLSDDGFLIPKRTTQDINNIADPNNPNGKGPGTIWYDSTTNQFKGNVNGVVKIFTVT